jgi:hypothetical protein
MKRLSEVIRHEGGKWVLYDHKGQKVLGRHDTKAGAEAQERAIHAHAHSYRGKLEYLHTEATCQVIHCRVEKRGNEPDQLEIDVKFGGKKYGGYLPQLR